MVYIPSVIGICVTPASSCFSQLLITKKLRNLFGVLRVYRWSDLRVEVPKISSQTVIDLIWSSSPHLSRCRRCTELDWLPSMIPRRKASTVTSARFSPSLIFDLFLLEQNLMPFDLFDWIDLEEFSKTSDLFNWL